MFTSEGVIMRGSHLLAHWCKTQQVIALSSAEAELNACVRGVSECIGAFELSRECGLACSAASKVDASAAKCMILRKGCGKVKHLSTRQLWVQGAVASRGIVVQRAHLRCAGRGVCEQIHPWAYRCCLCAHPCKTLSKHPR